MNFVKNHCWGLLSIITTIFVAVVVYLLASSSALKQYQLTLVSNDANISSLPYIWKKKIVTKMETSLGSIPNKKHLEQTKNFTFVTSIESLDAERLALYIPYYEHQLTLFINGQKVDDLGLFPEFQGSFLRHSVYLLLQKSWFKEGENTIDMTVNTGDLIFGSLSNVYLGPAKALASRYQLKQFFEQDVKLLLFGAQFMFLITCLTRLYGRPQDKSNAWLALACFILCLAGIHIFVIRLPEIVPFTHWFSLLIPIFILCIVGFRRSFQNKASSKYLRPVIFIYISALLMFVVVFDVELHNLLILFSLPLASIFTVYLLVLYAKDIWVRDNPNDAFMFSVFLFLLISIGIIGILKTESIDLVFNFTPIFIFCILAGLAVLLANKQSSNANLVDQAATELVNQLALKTRELETSFVQQRGLAEKSAKAKERQRITADLHDGVAGHLTTMLALIEIGDATNENLNEIANTALTDLRMVIETLALPEGELRGALAAFRERCVAPLYYIGVDIEWNLIELPRIEYLNSEQLLSILRLVQEAITNAMKHGKATRLDISGWQPDTATGCISITNSGGLPLQDYTPGHGIKNMQKRAAGIGGTLDIVKTYSGAVVNFRIPILR